MNALLRLDLRRRPHRPGRIPSWLVPSLLVLAVALGLGAGQASADACSSCPAPSAADFDAAAGRALGELPWSQVYETLACECAHALSGTPTLSQGPAWLVMRGLGEVWNCPESSSSDTISMEISDADSTEWSLTGEVSATLKALAFEAAARVSAGVGGGRTITEVKSVSKNLQAAMGHRIPWEGYFEVAQFSLALTFDVSRRWSWWVKGMDTGDTVLQSGSIYASCGQETVTLTRRASIGYTFHLGDRPCGPGPAPTTDLGLWPAPPAPPPAITPGPGPAPGPTPAPGSPPSPAPNPAPSGPPPYSSSDPEDDGPYGLTPPAPLPPNPPLPYPPPIPTNPHPEDSGEMGTAPTGPVPPPWEDVLPWGYGETIAGAMEWSAA